MLIEKSQKITFIHGWLFGPYIWSGVREYFTNIKKHKLISLAGYSSKTTVNNEQIVNNLLKSAIQNDIILSYSYSAALILSSNNLVSCKGTVILINPFFKPKENSISDFYIDIKIDPKKIKSMKQSFDVLKRNKIKNILIDMVDFPGYSYHSGIVFSIFQPKSGVPLINGGQYKTPFSKANKKERKGMGFDIDLISILKLQGK